MISEEEAQRQAPNTPDRGWLGAWLCFLAVCVVVGLSFRSGVRHALLALLPVTVGCIWLLGICGIAGVRINLFPNPAAVVSVVMVIAGPTDRTDCRREPCARTPWSA